ncbi:hypothetical protein LAZ67_6002408 [Cordylochernes scorpioides]|uniref:Uncharacterized protein n=1 Tax=Cordylochernes scorpioides TaxID=51811 RepID=A0ABY6KK65_9ARAC|nr:hypothetical protein LAZ67_6002408 [Cordylochernes scorpioides]
MASKEERQKRGKYRILKLGEKLDVLSDIKKGLSYTTIMQKYKISKTTVYDIKKSELKLTKFVDSTEKDVKKFSQVKNPLYENVDKAVNIRYESQRLSGVPIRGIELQTAASHFASKLNNPTFKASGGWLSRYRARHNLKNKKVVGEALSADEDAANRFKDDFHKLMTDEKYEQFQIYNADETGVYWKSLPDNSQVKNANSASGHKQSKDRLSVLLCANADASHKNVLAVVGKSKRPRAIKNIIDRLPVHYYSSHKAWFNQSIFSEWVFKRFINEVRNFQENKLRVAPDQVKALLLVDNSPAHPTELISNDGNIKCKFLPPNTTSVLQPMDQGFIVAFKRLYKRRQLESCLYDIKKAIFNFGNSWDELKSSTIRNGWKILLEHKHNSDLETAGDALQLSEDESDEDEQEIRRLEQLFQRARIEVSQESINEWIDIDLDDPGHNVLSNDDIVEAVLSEKMEISSSDDSYSTSEDSLEPDVPRCEALKSLDVALKYLEKRTEPEMLASYNTINSLRTMLMREEEAFPEKQDNPVKDVLSPAMKTELKGRGSGGILIGIKKNFQHTVRKIETNPYWISVLTHKFLDKTTESICLLFAYSPPNVLQEQNLTNLLRHIDYHMSEGNEVLIAGDINIRIGNAGGFHNPLKLNSPLNKYRKSKDLISSKLSEKLISFTDSNSITIANGITKGDTHGSFTFISERGSSVLDYFMYTHGLTQIISDMWIEELSYSDHLPIVLQINTGYEAIKSSYKNEILTRKFIWTKENVEMLKHNLSDIEVGNETDINTETVNFTKQIYTAMESANIIKFSKRRHQLSKPWYDKDCYIMKKTTKVSLQRCRNSNNIHDRQKYIEAARREYFKLLQRKRDEFNKDKNERIKNAKDPKSFWNAIASFRKKTIIQGEIDIKEWFLFYKNLLNKENKEATFTLNQMIGWKDPDLDVEITLEEIHDVVKKLANGKAVGLDGIPNELLKNLPIPTLTKLKNLFNKIMSTEKYPQLWTNSIVHPIFKSGDKNNPTNYRGIALCSNISKLFTTILRNRLNNWIEKREIILENQAGFRKNRSCTDHIILLNSLIQLSLRRKRGKLYVFFVDLTKAFDTVPHDLLWQKLHKMGISNKFVMLIKNFYQEAKITIRWKGQYSSNVKINSGVLQGESLSPLLFILYMADLIELYNNSALTGFYLPDFGVLHLLMYADDIAIIG